MKKTLLVVLALTLTAIFSACPPQNQEADQGSDTPEPMQETAAETTLNPGEELKLLTGTWTTEYEWPEYGTVKEVGTYSEGPDENTLSMNFKIYSGEEQIDEGTGIITYDPETMKTSSKVNSATGAIYTSWEVERIGNLVIMEGTATDSPGMEDYRIKITYLDQDHYEWVMYLPSEEEDWSEVITILYTRKVEL
jgi:hypothetical protein